MSFQDLELPKVLISEAQIQQRIQELAQEITEHYHGKPLTVLAILKGSFIFFADLIRAIDLPLHCEFMGVSSYGAKAVSSGEVKVTLDLTEPLHGKHVLIVEDIVDSGITLQYLMNHLKARKPASMRVCTLLFKPQSLVCDLKLDYTGFKIGSEFVVGYGLDYAERFRQLPYIGILEHEPH